MSLQFIEYADGTTEEIFVDSRTDAQRQLATMHLDFSVAGRTKQQERFEDATITD